MAFWFPLKEITLTHTNTRGGGKGGERRRRVYRKQQTLGRLSISVRLAPRADLNCQQHTGSLSLTHTYREHSELGERRSWRRSLECFNPSSSPFTFSCKGACLLYTLSRDGSASKGATGFGGSASTMTG